MTQEDFYLFLLFANFLERRSDHVHICEHKRVEGKDEVTFAKKTLFLVSKEEDDFPKLPFQE